MAAPVEGALEALQAFRALGFTLHALSSRPPSSQNATHRFLHRCFPGLITSLHLTQPHGAPKGAVARSIGAWGLLDDQLPHVLDAVAQGVPAALFDFGGQYTWTKTGDALPPGAVRLSSWPEVV
ncbi:unnamed protein product, partial [Symbiodinium sp. CCMP2456]